jgi:hypothetical protein
MTDETEIKVPGQVRPTWDEISKELDKLLTPKEEVAPHES